MTADFVVRKIMIVEDNPVNQKVMQRLIKILGHESISITDGFEAFEKIKLLRPAVILMDIQLIDISGIDITRAVKDDPELKDIPVIVVTASATADDQERIIRESKCDDYLSKPFLPQELSDKISRYIAVKEVDFK
jgi:two-component system cell cycle response regulator DivK